MEIISPGMGNLTRRKVLQQSLLAGGFCLSGLDNRIPFGLFAAQSAGRNRDQSFLGVVPFSGEGNPPMGEPIGTELDGRLFTDLSAVTPDVRVTPTEQFFIRTLASKLLDTTRWDIQIGGLVNKAMTVPVEALTKKARYMGAHLMECSGNPRAAHFGMLSVAAWDGVPLQEILERANSQPSGARVLVSGFDRYQDQSMTSVPGASWIFSQDQLVSSRAFLATTMNGQRLSVDHGAPVRLVVPGWYGCVSIKWVNQINFVAEDAPATSQMREYAGRTLQRGVPSLARDYQPATIGSAAMPVRIEKWRIDGNIRYQITGIRWGPGSSAMCEIRFGPEEEFIPVDRVEAVDDAWSFWTYEWIPKRRGEFTIRLRLKGEKLDNRKLDSGYYDRSLEIAEI
jgi:DMSO/TMAO reductase YedYZ molybdopterin-dependent catalytic subunit